MFVRSLIVPLLLTCGLSLAAADINFDRQIRPILSDNCFTCHGPDEKHRMAGLHFDTKDGAFSKPGVIVSRDSAHSRMYLRISNPNETMRMPPAYSGHKLTSQQVELIKTWIDQGAKWETHWAFVAPKRPELPEVNDKSWIRTPIDRFVLAKLEKEGFHPQPEAAKAILLRRVTFDLTGLPPTPAELKAFLSDSSPTAYEKVVDRLLASPHYGERMAMQWLDFARYADSHGYHIDSAREMWPWRDWVIDAFNRNMPYDEFTIEQLAGDLLPNAAQPQVIASGFNRNHMINFEGGAIPEEYQNEYVVDRIEATSTTWLGITLGCARCHNHKYDPLLQKDFYSFGAFFNSVDEDGLDGKKGNAKPMLQLPNPQQSRMKDMLLTAIRTKDQEIAAAQSAWEHRRAVPALDIESGLISQYKFDGTLGEGKVVSGKLTFEPGQLHQAASFTEEPTVTFGSVGEFNSNQPFSVAMWLKPEGPSGMTILQHYQGTPKTGPGYEIALDYCTHEHCNIIVRLRANGPDTGLEVRSAEGIPLSEWSHITVAYDGSGHANGVQVFKNGQSVKTNLTLDKGLEASFAAGDLQIGNKDWGTPYKGKLEDLRFYNRQLNPNQANQLAIADPLNRLLAIAPEHRSEEQAKWVRSYFLSDVGSAAEKQLGRDRKTLQRGFDQLDHEIVSTMVMKDLPTPRETFVLKRGDYRNHGDKVEPNTPGILPPLPKDAPRNRLTLAKWLVDPANPLVGRVAVNHFWQMYFGLGLVKTSEDFGSQGDSPANQELLDWMATEFVGSHWNVKNLQRLIVLSAVYRQASVVSPDLFEKDPENRLLAHGPRFRLPAEMVRDNALAISGLMNDKIGGASVRPYQPKGLWEEMAFGGEYSAQTYQPSHGSDLYRRSMYTFWKRTVPYPSLNTFDAPDREKCTARRGVTNTPLQALVLMNDPTFVEAARALAQREMKEAGTSRIDKIRYGFRLATDREPSPKELSILQTLYDKELTHYRDNVSAAESLLQIGESKADPKYNPAELAAYTLVSSTILNMDETITKN